MSSQQRTRRALIRISISLLAFVFMMLLLEIVVRAIPLYPDPFIIPDANLGWRLQPDAAGVWVNANCPREFTNHVQINHAGLNDVDHDTLKPDGTRRVLILGDSLVAAMEVPREQAFFRLLDANLNADEGQRYEVMAVGVPNYSTVQEWLLFDELGKSYSPDLVLLLFTPHNDFTDNHPAFAALSSDFFMSRPYYEVHADGTEQIIPPHENPLPPIHRLLLQNSALYRLLVLRARALSSVNPATDPALRDAYAESWELTFTLVDRVRQDVEATGARFAVLIDQSHIASADERATYHALIKEGLDARGITSFSLLQSFDSAQVAGTVVRFPCDTHWTPAGHALAATTLAPFIHQMFETAEAVPLS